MPAPPSASASPPHAEAPQVGLFEISLAMGAALVGLATILLLPAEAAALNCGFLILVLVIVRSDARSYTIPDGASASLALLGALQVASSARLQEIGISAALAAAALSGAVAFALFWSVAVAHRWLRGHEGMGFGDVKLAGALAVWLSPAEQATTLELAALGGIALLLATSRGKTKLAAERRAVPFGALLAPAAWAVHMLGNLMDLGWLS